MIYTENIKFYNTYKQQDDEILLKWTFEDGFDDLESAKQAILDSGQILSVFKFVKFNNMYYPIAMKRAEEVIIIAKDYIWYEQKLTHYLKKYKREEISEPLYKIISTFNMDFNMQDKDIQRLHQIDKDIKCLDINGNILKFNSKIAGYYLAFIWSMFDTLIDVYKIDSYRTYKNKEFWNQGIKAINPHSGESIKADKSPYFYRDYCKENNIEYIEPDSQKYKLNIHDREQNRKKECLRKLEYYKTNALNIEKEYCSIYEEIIKVEDALNKNVNIFNLESLINNIERKIEYVKNERKNKIAAEALQKQYEQMRKMTDWAFDELIKRGERKYNVKHKQNHKTNINSENNVKGNYKETSLLTPTEQKFYKLLIAECMKIGMIVNPKVRIEDFINAVGKDRFANRNRIKSRHIDFLICDNNMKVKLAVELDDYTHNAVEAKEIDNFKDQLFKEVGIPLIRIKVKNDYSNDIKQIINLLQ